MRFVYMPNAKTCPIPTTTINNRVGTSCDEHSNVSFNTQARMSKGELLVNPQSYGSYTFRQINFKDFFSCFQGLRFLQKLKIGIFNPLLNSSCMAITRHEVIYDFYPQPQLITLFFYHPQQHFAK